MKRYVNRFLALTFIVLASCGGPDALVINSLNQDGSVDRKIILTWDKNEFDLAECQVPVDSTWSINTDMEVSEKGDTTWTLTAEKHFDSVDLINSDYESFGGPNEQMSRNVVFIKRFRWFNTTYYLEEKVDRAIDGYPVADFFTPDEIKLFHMPGSMTDALLSGPDSTAIKAALDTIEEKKDRWLFASLFKATCSQIEYLNDTMPGQKVDLEFLKSREGYFLDVVGEFEGDEVKLVDTIYGKGFYESHREILDSSLSVIEDKFQVAFDADGYQVQSIMPGKLVATNGYIDNDSNILWKVEGDSFVSEDHIMG